MTVDTSEKSEEALPSAEELKQLLWAHADTTAERVIDLLGGPLSSNNLTRFLEDENCLRYPTEILFSEEGLAPHQFAQPHLYVHEKARRCMLHIHPRYRNYPEAIPRLVAYMAASIMYGEAADSDLCEHFGAMLLGHERQRFYTDICALADWRP